MRAPEGPPRVGTSDLDQQHRYAGVQKNEVAVANVRIVGNELMNDAGDLFLLDENLGVSWQSRVIGLPPARISHFFAAAVHGLLMLHSPSLLLFLPNSG